MGEPHNGLKVGASQECTSGATSINLPKRVGVKAMTITLTQYNIIPYSEILVK